MSNRVNVDLSINTTAYQQDLDKATQSTAAYETETRKVKDATISFNKEMRTARKTAMDLAASYAQLSKADKDSDFGKEMKRQLDQAMEKAAEFVDMQGDLRQQMKNMASDTRVLDTLSEGFGVVADTVSTAIGAIAQYTGREEDAKRAVVAFTTAQSALGAITKIQNALQMQSNTMLAVTKIQSLAAAAAEKIRTAAQEKGTIATKGATAAQAALNLVAKANPYVLLATAVLAVGTAMVAYAFRAQKAEDVTEKLNKDIHDASIQGQKDAQAEIVKVNLLYKAATSDKLGKEQRLKAAEDLQKLYPAYFSNMSKEQIMLGQSSNAYKQLAADIIAVAKAKAYEQKITQSQEELIDLEDQLDKQKQLTAEADKQAKAANRAAQNRPMISNGSSVPGDLQGQININRAVVQSRKEEDKIQQKINNKKEYQAKLEDKMLDFTKEKNRLDSNNVLKGKNVGSTVSSKGGGSGSGSTDNEIKATAGSITELESEVSDLQKKLKDGLIPDSEVESTKKHIKDLQSQIKTLNIKFGFEEPKTKLQELQEKVDAAKLTYEVAVESNDQNAIDAAKELYNAAYNEWSKHKLKLKLDDPVTDEDRRKVQEEIDKLVNETLNPKTEIKWDFSDLPEEMQSAADKTIEQYNRIKDAVDDLNEAMSETKDPQTINMYKDALEKLEPTLESATSEMQKYQQQADERKAQKKQAEQMNKRNEALGSYIDMIKSTSDALGVLGDSEEAQMAQFTLNTAATIANAIKTIAAMQAEAIASGTASGARLPYPYNIAAIATIVATIASVFASLPKFAQGGVVGGNSTVGDKLLARVNSKETILTEKQASNALDLMDNKAVGISRVVGEIDGTKIILVAKNVMKSMKKSGKNITF